MLSSALNRHEADKMIHRKMYSEIPPRIESSLTSEGKELMPTDGMMVNWALEHFDDVIKWIYP